MTSDFLDWKADVGPVITKFSVPDKEPRVQ